MHRNLCSYTSGIIRRIEKDTNAYDASDKVVEIEAEIEIDLRARSIQ